MEDKITQLEIWLDGLCSGQGSLDKYIQKKERKGHPDESGAIKDSALYEFYTEEHKYSIVAIDKEAEPGYLGCQVSCRKPRPGEDWTRGNDLPDGPFTYQTWQNVLRGIVQFELVKLSVQDTQQGCSPVSGPPAVMPAGSVPVGNVK